MKFTLVLLIGFLLPPLALSQTESDVLEGAKTGLIEKLYKTMAPMLRSSLDDRHVSEDEIDTILFGAIDAYAACIAVAAQQKAREQGLPKDIILKGIGSETQGKEKSKILLELVTDALKVRQSPRDEQISSKTGVQIR